MNKFKSILVLGTAANVFCGCYGVKLSDVSFDCTTDISNTIGDNDINNYGKVFKFQKPDIGKNVRIFGTGNCIVIVGNATIYNKQEANVKSACTKLDDSDLYYCTLNTNTGNFVSDVTATKDDKKRGKYTLNIPNQDDDDEDASTGGKILNPRGITSSVVIA